MARAPAPASLNAHPRVSAFTSTVVALCMLSPSAALAADLSAAYRATTVGTKVTVTITMCNEDTSAATVRVGLWGHRDAAPTCSSSADAEGDFTLVASACQTVSITEDFAGAPAGNYTSWIFVDRDCKLTEGIEHDNVAGADFTIGATSDLEVRAFTAVPSGNTVTYAGTLCNTGAATADFDLSLWLDTKDRDPCSGAGANFAGRGALAANSCLPFSFPGAAPQKAGAYQARVLLDSRCEIVETTGGNAAREGAGAGNNEGVSIFGIDAPVWSRAPRMSADQMVPAVTNSGSGSATAMVPAARDRIDLTLTESGLSGITGADVHVGEPGKNGPVIFRVATRAFTSPFSRSLAKADLLPAAAAGITTFAQAVTALLSGRTYVVIKTATQATGALRGTIRPTTSATYKATFTATWSAATHPDRFPPSPHFSGLVGGLHRAGVAFWGADHQASAGVRSMAETGAKRPLETAVKAAIARGTADQVLSGSGIAASPGSVSLTFTATQEHPRVTLTSMLAPSPDWFVGVAGSTLIENGDWVRTKTVTLYAYDAGTDSGAIYTSPDSKTAPPLPIRRIAGAPFLVSAKVVPVGTLTVTKQPYYLHAFRKQRLTSLFYSEASAVADIDKDGNVDVVSGPFWYEGPAFTTARTIYTPVAYSPLAYSENMGTWAYDFNGDGWLDILVAVQPARAVRWYENPKTKTGTWKMHTVTSGHGHESATFVDVVGDSRPEFVATDYAAALDRFGYFTPDPTSPTKAWTFHAASTGSPILSDRHGLGVGDLNSDGRKDIIAGQGFGWWEQPASLVGDPLWTFHKQDFGAGSQIHITDVDGDGDMDVLASDSGHGYGLSWYEAKKVGTATTFTKHVIMSNTGAANEYGVAFSEIHASAHVDIDGDGLEDLVTGKRWWAHGPVGDPGAGDPAVLYWFRLTRSGTGAAGVKFVPFLIDSDSGVGVHLSVADLNADGLVDIVSANKKGTAVLRHVRAEVSQVEWAAAQPKPVTTP